jgi:hypothetical protein
LKNNISKGLIKNHSKKQIMKLTNKLFKFGFGIFAIILVVIALSSMNTGVGNQEKDLSLARAQKMSGKYVFLKCEPVNDYDVAFEIKGFTLGNFDTPDEIANFVIKNALKISAKENKDFDGVVIGNGKVDIAIKFK